LASPDGDYSFATTPGGPSSGNIERVLFLSNLYIHVSVDISMVN